MCGVVTMTHLPGIHGTSIVVPLHLTNGCASTGKMFISQEKRNTPSRNFAFFPFKFFEISDLYCLGEYLRAHRKLT